jgi:lipopolysaccharide transport protein LptA
MAASFANRPAIRLRERTARRHVSSGAAVLAFASTLAWGAQPISLDQGFDWSADHSTTDLRNDTTELVGSVRVTQGPTSIEAERASVSAFRSDNPRWMFIGAVQIRTADADLRADSASAMSVKGQIARARIEGSPAEFEQRGEQRERQVRGRAGVIEYDFGKGTVKLTKDVWFSYGKDEFRGDTVIYNIRDERVQVNPDGESSGRVKGTIRPGARDERSQNTPSDSSSPQLRVNDESGA